MDNQWKNEWDKLDLSEEEKRFLIKVVNRYSSQMPMIDLDSFHYLNPRYAKELLEEHKDKFILLYKRMSTSIIKRMTKNDIPSLEMTDLEKEEEKGGNA